MSQSVHQRLIWLVSYSCNKQWLNALLLRCNFLSRRKCHLNMKCYLNIMHLLRNIHSFEVIGCLWPLVTGTQRPGHWHSVSVPHATQENDLIAIPCLVLSRFVFFFLVFFLQTCVSVFVSRLCIWVFIIVIFHWLLVSHHQPSVF